MWPPIGPPECRPTPRAMLRTSPRGRVRLDRGILEEPSRNRTPHARRDLRPQYSCHFEDSQTAPSRLSDARGKPRKPCSTARPIDGPPMSLLSPWRLHRHPGREASASCSVTFSWKTGELSRWARWIAPRTRYRLLRVRRPSRFHQPHHHVANTLLRGLRTNAARRDASESLAIDEKLTRCDVQIGALLGCVEMIRSGTTSFHDLFYWEDEMARPCAQSGMRGFLSWSPSMRLSPRSTEAR